jgi:hypothetical protein
MLVLVRRILSVQPDSQILLDLTQSSTPGLVLLIEPLAFHVVQRTVLAPAVAAEGAVAAKSPIAQLAYGYPHAFAVCMPLQSIGQLLLSDSDSVSCSAMPGLNAVVCRMEGAPGLALFSLRSGALIARLSSDQTSLCFAYVLVPRSVFRLLLGLIYVFVR